MRRPWPGLLLGLFFAAYLGGCAVPERPRVVFPPPPETPRMEYIGVYESQNDYPKTGWQIFVEKAIGLPPLARVRGPMGIVSDGKGKVYVSDVFDRNIRVFDFNARTVDYMFKSAPFDLPLGLALDKGGRLYVADGDRQFVYVVSIEEGRLVSTIGSSEVFTKPSRLAFNERLGRLYVSDSVGCRIVVFDLDGKHLFSFGQKGPEEGNFFTPQGIAIDDQDRVFVADQMNARIQVFDADGEFLYLFGERGDQVYQLESPVDVAFDSEGNLHVVDRRKPFIAAYSPEGRLLLATGTDKVTTNPLGFSTPTMLHIDANDRLFVTDYLNRRFSVWQYLSAAYLEKHPVTKEDLRRLRESGSR